MTKQVTTLTVFRYSGLRSKLWAFGMMQFGHKYLGKADGLQFYKLMGSGKGLGFNPFPDWSTYALLCVWDDLESAEEFIDHSELHKLYEGRTDQMLTLYMSNIKSHGLWSGQQPFEPAEPTHTERVAVITRANIKPKMLYKFWKYVPTAQAPIATARGLVYTKGIGEVPLLQMATFSIWESIDALKDYAYHGKEHREAIALTKKYDWYSEELFARFQILKTKGVLKGVDV